MEFFAQSLDNASSDPIQKDDHLLADDDGQVRDEIAQKRRNISLQGREIFAQDNVRIFWLSSQSAFLMEVIGEWRDEANRLSPVVCIGEVPGDADEKWKSHVFNSLDDFVIKIGRQLGPEIRDACFRGLSEVVKKKLAPRRWLILPFLLLLLLLAYFTLFTREVSSPQKPPSEENEKEPTQESGSPSPVQKTPTHKRKPRRPPTEGPMPEESLSTHL